VIAHRLSTIVNADEILVMERGRIIERGTHNELVLLSGHYADMWRRQKEAADEIEKIQRLLGGEDIVLPSA
jgi:ATP-binding cassette subfamily B protein